MKQVAQVSPDPQEKKPPVGYIRAKIFNRSVLVKTLIDSGNLFADLISEKLAKLLKLTIHGSTKTVGTAAASGTVTVLGKTKPFYIFLEEISGPVKVSPYVVKDLVHPLNLGQAFLRGHKADMTFRPEGIQLRLNGMVTSLATGSAPLSKASIDVRIKSLLDKWKDVGKNPNTFDSILDLRVHAVDSKPQEGPLPGVVYGDFKRPVQFDATHYNAYNKDEVILKAGCSTIVQTTTNAEGSGYQCGSENDVFMFPKKDSAVLNRNLVWVHPGSYTRVGNITKVLVSNFGKKAFRLPKSCKLGHLSEATGYAEAINVLDHRPLEQLSEEEVRERREYIITTLKLEENSLIKGEPGVKEEIIQLFMDNWDAISVSESDFGKTDLLKFHIQVPKGTPPVRAKVRSLNPKQEADLKRQLDAWTEAKVIEPSMSPWASALVPCVKKGSDSYRWAIDYRKLNLVTVKDSYPLSNIDNNLNKLTGSTVFSTLDSAGAFHTMVVDEASRDYTTFVSPFGSYRFARVPFGVANAPSSYSRLVALALNRLPGNFALGYIDDVIVYSKNLSEHVAHLRQVVHLHVSCGMKLNLKKCQIAHDTVQYLGHQVSKNGIAMIDSYVDKILDWPLPTDASQLKSFLGFSGYYRSFIKDYSRLTNLMNKMKKDKVLVWSETAKANFKELKEAFKTRPVRGFPQYDTGESFILDTDFSSKNMAAVLSQKQQGKETFLGCVAKKCDKAQESYPPHKGEMAAVILGLRKFEHILRSAPFIIRTDSKCVEFLRSMKEVRGMYARWQAFLASFTFSTVHRSGKLQMNADPLSRRPGLEESGEAEPLDPEGHLHDVDDIYAVQNEPKNPAPLKKELSLPQLAKVTKEDPVLGPILKYVSDGHKPNTEERKGLMAQGLQYVNVFECLQVEEGVLYFQPPQVNGKQGNRRVCLPLAVQGLAFDLVHAHPMGGHFGQQNTYRKLRDRFYFPGMYSYVTARVHNCVPCVTKRSTRPKPDHQMHREQLSYFAQRIYIDTVGRLTGVMYEGRMCCHFMTIQDGFTRYLVAVPVDTIDAPTLAEAIVNKWCMVFGCPEVIHSDQGSAFTSQLFKEVMTRLGVVKTHTPSYSPEANRIERAHRVIGDILRADRSYEARQWPQKLIAAVMAYNTTINRVIGITPYEALFGRRAILPVDLVFPFQRKEGRSWSNYIETLKLRFQELARKICKAQESSLNLDSSGFQGRSPRPFKVGDYVYYFLGRTKVGLSKKLQSRYIGPWRVRRVVSDSLVVIYPEGNWAESPRELASIVSRLRKVDPKLSMGDLNPSRRKRVDLMEVLDDLDEMSEVLNYQDSFEEEDDSPLPLVSANHQFAPQLRPEGPQPGPDVGPPAEEELGSQGGAQEENLLEGERSPRGHESPAPDLELGARGFKMEPGTADQPPREEEAQQNQEDPELEDDQPGSGSDSRVEEPDTDQVTRPGRQRPVREAFTEAQRRFQQQLAVGRRGKYRRQRRP